MRRRDSRTSLAHLECEVATSYEVYSHSLFVGLIHDVWLNESMRRRSCTTAARTTSSSRRPSGPSASTGSSTMSERHLAEMPAPLLLRAAASSPTPARNVVAGRQPRAFSRDAEIVDAVTSPGRRGA